MKSIFFPYHTDVACYIPNLVRLAIEGVLEMLTDNAIGHLSHPGDQNTNREFHIAVFNISDIISMISISKTCYSIFLHLMAIHDEGRFTMIQTKNTKLSKKKCVQKWQKPESQDFYKSIFLSTVK